MRENIGCPRILLADDFPPFLEQTDKFLRNDYEIVGFARDGGEALNLCLALSPDILLLDLAMPVLCGLEVAARLKELGCASRIIFVTGQEDHDFVEEAFSLGASGYVLKCRIAIDLLPAIDAALKGSTFTSPFPARVGATSPERR
jgi:DNA-binding NarL/FixJ family response regulator